MCGEAQILSDEYAETAPTVHGELRERHESFLKPHASPIRVTLCVVAMNPPVGSGNRTRNQVEVASHVIGCGRFEIVNLCARPTSSTRDLHTRNIVEADWAAARPALTASINAADEVLFAWGVNPLPGTTNLELRNQIRFVLQLTNERGREVWSVGGQPRHPSRWHQYVSDKHGRTVGGSFEDRLAQVLVRKAPVESCGLAPHLLT